MHIATVAKAIVAAIGAVLTVVVDEDTAQAVVAALTALLVYVVPNG